MQTYMETVRNELQTILSAMEPQDALVVYDVAEVKEVSAKGEKIAYWLLWPHAKPWHFTPVRPMLRCLDDAQEAAQCLSRVVAKQQTAVVTPVRTAPVGPRGKLAADPRAHTTAMSQG